MLSPRQASLFGASAGLLAAVSGIAGFFDNSASSATAVVLGVVAVALAGYGWISLWGSAGEPDTSASKNQLSQQEQASADAVALRHLELLTRGGPKPLVDPETSLPDDRYFELALEGRVAAARRHLWPVTLVLLQISLDEIAIKDPAVRKDALARFSLLLQGTMRESDVLCRVDDSTFALLLDDTAEEGGVWSAERLQAEASRQHPAIIRLVAGVASYPSHGLDAEKVHKAAKAALSRASGADAGKGLGSVEVAHADH